MSAAKHRLINASLTEFAIVTVSNMNGLG